jgi:type I restriction enzyme S subunit
MSVTISSAYKQSELGEIPENWDCFTVQQLIDKGAIVGHLDGNHGELYPRSHEFKKFGVPYIGANNFYSGQVDIQGCKFLSEEKASLFKKGVAQDGDILFAHNATVGPVAKLKTSIKYVILSTTATYFRTNGLLLNNDYLMHYMRSELFSGQYRSIMSQSTRNQVPITAQRKLVVVAPPIEEQIGIASSLSHVDDLINSLDKLIAKKRDIQQAVMQQLLTGQRRLPGFSGEWVVKRLGNHFSFLRNGTNSRAELSTEGDVLYLHYGDIHGSQRLLLNPTKTSMPSLPNEKAKRLDRLENGDLIFADASEDLDGVGKSVEVQGLEDMKLVAGLHTIALRFDKKVMADGFKAYLQFIPTFRSHLRQLAAGTKVYATNRAHIASAELKTPGIEEQAAIATILSDMDTEITALETRRNKARQIKQGMMQELLTGRIRLIGKSD